ncbi:MAG TPA: pilus assembly protein PilM, partial [Actinotalea sp.]|nr:pilus assembly protein PilM [Actinotalea sp.]
MIGLDLGTTRARAVELQVGRGAPTVVRYAEAPLPLGAVQDGEVTEREAVVPALRQMWAQGKFSTKDVVIGVGNRWRGDHAVGPLVIDALGDVELTALELAAVELVEL